MKWRLEAGWFGLIPNYITRFSIVVFISNVIVNEHIVIVNNNNIQCRRDVDVSLLQSISRNSIYPLDTMSRKISQTDFFRTLGSCLRRKTDQSYK